MAVANVKAQRRGWLREERLAPLTEVAVFVFGLAGLVVLEGPANRPEVDVESGAFLSYFEKRGSVTLGSFLIMLSVVSFLARSSP